MILELDLVPASSWGSNVRSILTKNQWTAISQRVRSQVYDICQICEFSNEQPLHAHEIWRYYEREHIQKLIGMIALCPSCHRVKHFGLARVRGKEEQALRHFMKINKITKKEAEEYINKSFKIWADRSSKKWTLDISILNDYGIDTNKIKKE